MLIHILGSAAGGGFPQWNCNCNNCANKKKPFLNNLIKLLEVQLHGMVKHLKTLIPLNQGIRSGYQEETLQ